MFDRCHVVKARREAQAADVVVVNHHLLMADLVLKEEGFGDLLPGADAIVIDEAHQLPEVAANFLGFAVSSRQLQSLARDLAAELLVERGADRGARGVRADARSSHLSICRTRCGTTRERSEFSEWPAPVIESLERVQSRCDDLGEVADAKRRRIIAGLAALRRRAAS